MPLVKVLCDLVLDDSVPWLVIAFKALDHVRCGCFQAVLFPFDFCSVVDWAKVGRMGVVSAHVVAGNYWLLSHPFLLYHHLVQLLHLLLLL